MHKLTASHADNDGKKTMTPYSSRPLLIFNHNPKAGGGSLEEIFASFKKNQIRVGNKKHKNIRDWNELDEILEQVVKKDEIDSTFLHVAEFSSTDLEQRKLGFVIGSVREPCSQYLSLWTFGSGGHGSFHKKHHEMNNMYGQDAPFFNSTRDVKAFQQWIRHEDVVGTVAHRFRKSYGKDGAGVDCFVFVERFQETLVGCLRDYEAQGGYVNWTVPELQKLVDAAAGDTSVSQTAQGGSTLNDSKNDPIGNPQALHHSSCRHYINEEIATIMKQGPESFIYSTFGYEGCCNPGNHLKTPPVVPIPIAEEIETPIVPIPAPSEAEAVSFSGMLTSSKGTFQGFAMVVIVMTGFVAGLFLRGTLKRKKMVSRLNDMEDHEARPLTSHDDGE